MKIDRFNRGLLAFIHESPTPFHAVANMAGVLQSSGFRRLDEGGSWRLGEKGRYYVVRNDGSLIAFTGSGKTATSGGFAMVGAHTDSPCLKLKPSPAINRLGYRQLGVEVYGGALLAPWFDRDLAVAGRLSGRAGGRLCHRLVDSGRAVAVIPSLAIHLDREVNKGRAINPQTQMAPLLGLGEIDGIDDLMALLNTAGEERLEEILDFELCLYDTQPPALAGMDGEFILGARLDNLLSCYIGLCAITSTDAAANSILICSDHEEVGSRSASGADGPFLMDTLRRLCPEPALLSRALSRSLLISADNAHAVHPNFADKHDESHMPRLNRGPVIKVNNNQRYASNSVTGSRFRELCGNAGVEVQNFAVRADMACGSTIGPITASVAGVSTVDVGVPQLAMHSPRECAGSRDSHDLYRVLCGFYARQSS